MDISFIFFWAMDKQLVKDGMPAWCDKAVEALDMMIKDIEKKWMVAVAVLYVRNPKTANELNPAGESHSALISSVGCTSYDWCLIKWHIDGYCDSRI